VTDDPTHTHNPDGHCVPCAIEACADALADQLGLTLQLFADIFGLNHHAQLSAAVQLACATILKRDQEAQQAIAQAELQAGAKVQ